MKKLLMCLLLAVFTASCGVDFFLNQPTVNQSVIFTRGERTLDLTAQTAVGDDLFRSQMVSDFYRGFAEVVYENGGFRIRALRLPVSDEQLNQLKSDIYAAYFAGGYPFKSSVKMFGETKFVNNIKYVYDTDGYELYKVRYTDRQIHLFNNILEYSIVVGTGFDYKLPHQD